MADLITLPYSQKPLQFGTIARNALMARYPHLWQGLVRAWYPRLRVQGGQVFDVSGYHMNGTITGADWVVSPYGYALDFSGATTDKIDCGTSPYGGLTAMSVECMARIGGTGDMIARDGGTHLTDGFYMYAPASGAGVKIEFHVNTSDGVEKVSSSQILLSGIWYHIVGVWESGQHVKVYIDGAENISVETIRTGTMVAGNANLTIGRSPGGLAFDGLVGYFNCYNRVLDPTEIKLQCETNGNALLDRRPSVVLRPAEAAAGNVNLLRGDKLYSNLLYGKVG